MNYNLKGGIMKNIRLLSAALALLIILSAFACCCGNNKPGQQTIE
jgi:hypothetical protein